VERTGLNSSDVLARLFDLEMKGFVRQLPGKQFSKIMLQAEVRRPKRSGDAILMIARDFPTI